MARNNLHGNFGMASSSALVRWVTAVAVLATPASLRAQADLDMSELVTGEVVTQTRTQSLSLTATNLGPSSVGNAVATSLVPISGIDLVFSATCPLTFMGPIGAQAVTWAIGPLSVGERRTCVITLRALPTTVSGNPIIALRLTSEQPDPIGLNNTGGAVFVVSNFDAISDLSVSVAQVPSTGLVPLDGSGRVYVTLRNVGPDAAASARVYSDYYQPPYYGSHAFLFFGVPEDPCSTRVDVELNYARVITGSGQGLAAGASLTCVIGIERRAGATNGTYILGWDTFLAGYGSNDPNPANNRAVIGLGISPVSSVPLLSHWGWLATLAVLVAVPAWRQLRRLSARSAA